MKCKNCQIELEIKEGKEQKVFCSDKCRKSYSRRLEKETPTSDKPTSDIAEQATKDTINKWGEDVKKMDAKTLYAFIRAYQYDSWKDSPEFKELNRRLKKPVEWLRANGYWIPNRLEPKRV